MSYGRALQIWKVLGLVLAGIFIIAAIVGIYADFDTTRDTVLWVVFLCAGAGLILVGQFAARFSAWLSAGLVSLGAVAGALPLFWSILVPLAAAAVIALSFAIARRSPTPT